MENKTIVILFILAIFFVPFGSNSTAKAYTNIDLIFRNTVSDIMYSFSRDHYSDVTQDWQRDTLQGDRLQGSFSYMPMSGLSGQKYRILQWTNPMLKPVITCGSDNPDRTFTYETFGVVFGPTLVDENILCDFNNNNQPINPVLIVPGILGTELKKGDETLWADPARMLTSISDNFMDPLAFNKDLTSSDSVVSVSNVIKSEIAFNYTEGLINEFQGQGYVENQNLFLFSYDWRYGVSGKYADGSPNGEAGRTNSDLLKDKIQQILTQTGSSKIDVIAHSNGGLVVKKYVMDNPTNNKINKAVFVGVPNTGAPKAIKALIQGDDFGVSFGPFGLNESEMKKIAENMPVSYDLLPSQTYYNVAGSPVSQVDIGYGLGIDEPTQKDLNYSDFVGYITDKGLNTTATTNSGNLHSTAFDNFDLRTAGVDLYAIDGCKTATLTNFLEVKYKDILGNYHTGYDNIELKTGDGTVPFVSATNLPINQNNKFYYLSGSHSKMMSADGGRQKIVNLISGSNLSVSSDLITQDINQCQLNGKAISVFSPLDIFVTDQYGNKLGLADDGSIINEITNADLEILGEHKFLYLPQDGGQTYSVGLRGTGTGTYTIKSENISNSQITKEEIFSDLPVTLALTGQINIGSGSTTLSVKQNPSDVLQTILPTKVLDFSTDKISPEAVIRFDPIAKDLKFVGTDDLSDIFGISVTDNGGAVILTDEAGNTTELIFKERNRRTATSAEITAIKYNGVSVAMSSNLFSYSWSLDKSGKLAKLTQKVKSRNNYSITAVYDGVNTKITGTISTGKISQSFTGLKILKVTTNKGDLVWSY